MKRVAALYDIHGNLPALEAVLAEVRTLGIDHVVVGGDVVPGPMPRETLDRLLQLDVPVQFIRGNGELAVLGDLRSVQAQFHDGIRWNAQQLTREHLGLLAEWPATFTVAIDGIGPVLFCHATPRDENEIFTRVTQHERVLALFGEIDAKVVVCGHTHMQFDRNIGTLRIVNAGSVGMPFTLPGAYWLLIDRHVQLRRTEYDLQRAAERICRSAYPQAREFAARNVLEPPSEQTMLAALER